MPANVVPSNTINLRLPVAPDTIDPTLYRELSIVYGALRQLQNGTDKYLDIPAQQKSAPYTVNYLDRGQSIDTNSSVSIPDESLAGFLFPLGTTISIVNTSNANISIIPAAGVSLILAATATVGTRTLANWGVAAIRKIGLNAWICLGAGVS
jgi:hypothetical protein